MVGRSHLLIGLTAGVVFDSIASFQDLTSLERAPLPSLRLSIKSSFIVW